MVGSVRVIFLSYHYSADRGIIFGMRGLSGLTINSGRGAREPQTPLITKIVLLSALQW